MRAHARTFDGGLSTGMLCKLEGEEPAALWVLVSWRAQIRPCPASQCHACGWWWWCRPGSPALWPRCFYWVTIMMKRQTELRADMCSDGGTTATASASHVASRRASKRTTQPARSEVGAAAAAAWALPYTYGWCGNVCVGLRGSGPATLAPRRTCQAAAVAHTQRGCTRQNDHTGPKAASIRHGSALGQRGGTDCVGCAGPRKGGGEREGCQHGVAARNWPVGQTPRAARARPTQSPQGQGHCAHHHPPWDVAGHFLTQQQPGQGRI